jgi:hypothetical protein
VPYLKYPEYRSMVAGLLEIGESFDDIEEWIDELTELSADEKAALWLFAFSLRDPAAEGCTRGRREDRARVQTQPA